MNVLLLVEIAQVAALVGLALMAHLQSKAIENLHRRLDGVLRDIVLMYHQQGDDVVWPPPDPPAETPPPKKD